ncbi:MAG: hypothetical protein ACYTGC_12650 [Planctomycetota bacterium]
MTALLSSHPVRRLVAAMLAFSMIVCCCQAHFLVHGFSEGELDDSRAKVESCCSAEQCTSSEDDAPDEPEAPCGTCTCCIKGLGVKGDTPVVLPLTIAALATAGSVAPVSTPVTAGVRPLDDSRRIVTPPTLLRLRCALVV